MRIANALRRLVHLIGVAAVVLCQPANAEDIDLFLQPAPAAGELPNVLILLDNTANWNTPFTAEIDALISTFESLPLGPLGEPRFRVGLMMFTETGSPNNNVDGGYVRAGIRDLNAEYKTKLGSLLSSLDIVGDKSNGGKAGWTMAEAYYYYDGATPRSGNYKVKTDYTGNNFGTEASKAVYALPGNALPNGGSNPLAGTPYNSPILPDSCAPNYIIYISNGKAQDTNTDMRLARGALGLAADAVEISGATAVIPVSPAASNDNPVDEWARFMKRSPLNITTYAIEVNPITTDGPSKQWTAQLKSVANVSDGKYFAVTTADGGAAVAAALGTIFSEIQAVNSVFASVSLPLSVSTQGTYLNQLYVGMFRPDQKALPRWVGNMKQYRLGVVDGVLTTVDADGSNVANTATGFILECARSYWTTEDDYWAFRPLGDCLRADADPRSNSPDGNITEKGAQAQVLRSTTTRNVKTCYSFTCPTTPTALDPFVITDSLTEAMLGAADDAERRALINYQLGLDVNDEDIDGRTTGPVPAAEMRPSAHGDVVHSRPVAINYGTDASPEVVVFYGGNDGVLRAINGNRSTAIGPSGAEVAAGQELWAFVAPEFFGNIKRLRDNIVPISYTGSTTTSSVPQPKPYGLDGSITAYKYGTTTWIYSTARRGGRVVYAFDVSTIHTDKSSPRLLWKIGCPNLGNDTGCETGFSGIGQTWSAPKVLKTAGYGSGAAPMLMMGGGYDSCEDGDPHTCTSSSKGRTVYLLDAETGAKLNEFPTDRPVAADVFVVPDTESGLAKYAYVVDLGGNIYRIAGESPNAPIGTDLPADWTITKIASLGCSSPSAVCAANRKFMFAPDVVEPPAPSSGVYHLLVGSGDREKPLRAFDDALGVSNYFFMVKDAPTNASWLSDETADCGEGVICLNSLTPITTVADPATSDLATSKGWYLGLTSGEQVVTSAITVFGVVTFSTHEPTDPDRDSCKADLGTARVYNIGYLNATSRNGTYNRFEVVSGGGLPPSPVAGLVRLDATSEPIPFIVGSDGGCPLCGRDPTPPSVSTQPKSLTYWYLQQ